jgi:acetyl esterase/lipase
VRFESFAARAAHGGRQMVCPDYRLAPEASGRDILADIADLLHWLLTHLPALAVKHGLTADLRRTLVVGDSAGGWLALQTALRYGSGVLGFPGAGSPLEIVAVISKFGMLNPAAARGHARSHAWMS